MSLKMLMTLKTLKKLRKKKNNFYTERKNLPSHPL